MNQQVIEPRPRPRLAPWLRLKLPATQAYGSTRALLSELALHTVCESARCPNQRECWSRGTATFMIAGDRCTRACKFCAVSTAKPMPLDPDEPARVAEAVQRMNLRHVVITAVARDDLADGGAAHFARTIEAVRSQSSRTVIEVLVPDFNDQGEAISMVLQARPHIFNHNVETVRRLTPRVRSRATYDRSLSVLAKARSGGPAGMLTKSGLMLGLGETGAELMETLRDLRRAGCDLLTLGQYLQPGREQLRVEFFVPPEQFAHYGRVAREMGFSHVASGPFVRSSYHAEEAGGSVFLG